MGISIELIELIVYRPLHFASAPLKWYINLSLWWTGARVQK